MALGKIKAVLSLVLIPVSVCLAAGLYISAVDRGSSTRTADAQRLRAFGMTYFAVFGNERVGIFDEEYKRLLEYGIGSSENVIVSSCISDLDNDGTDEILLLTGARSSEYANELSILKMQNVPRMDVGRGVNGAADSVSIALIYKRDMTELNPWKVQTCDTDGDGRTEISLGVYKTARFHPVMAKRPFIFEWNGNAILPKWLGSRLARPFDDYIFSDIDGDGSDELISAERLEDGRKIVNSYSWKGFGFEGTGESDAFDDIIGIWKTSVIDGKEQVEALIDENGRQKRIILHFSGNKLEYSFADTGTGG